LGSWWAFLPAILAVTGIVTRTALEDRPLQRTLDGYAEFADRVRSDVTHRGVAILAGRPENQERNNPLAVPALHCEEKWRPSRERFLLRELYS
jgi:hypothetical protein